MSDREMKSPENLYLLGALLLFVLLPFQNCAFNPISMLKAEAALEDSAPESSAPVYSAHTTQK